MGTGQEGVAVIKPGKDERRDLFSRCLLRQKATSRGDAAEFPDFKMKEMWDSRVDAAALSW